MLSLSPVKMILIGLFLVVLGIVLPFLMVLDIIKSTFFLNFFSYGSSLAGLFLGLIGAASYVRERRRKERDSDSGMPFEDQQPKK